MYFSTISCARKPLILLRAQKLNQISNRKVRRIALAVVAELAAKGEGRHVGRRQHLAAVARTAQNRADKPLMLPGKPAKEDGHAVAFLGGERTLVGPVKVLDLPARASDLHQPRMRATGALPVCLTDRIGGGAGIGWHGGKHLRKL